MPKAQLNLLVAVGRVTWLVALASAISVPAVRMNAAAAAGEMSLPKAIDLIRSVGAEGMGNGEAAAAWKLLAAQPVEELPVLLAGMDGANDYAVNWLSAAVDAVAAKGSVPVATLGEFLFDTSHHPRARHRAYELVAVAQPDTAVLMLSGLLTDPGADLRREAVEQWIRRAEETARTGNRGGAVLLYRQALTAARDAGQIDGVTTALRGLGQAVDLPQVFGFLMSWHVIGPFDNTGLRGFSQAFPPEQEIRLDAEYAGKSGASRWIPHTSTNEHGLIDLNRLLGKTKEVTAYAATRFHSDRDQRVELRLGCKNAWKVWVNGELLFGRDEYHMGAEIDQYRLPVSLRAGTNLILVKVCQNELVEDWTEEWEFQLRVTDSLGTPIRPAGVATKPRI